MDRRASETRHHNMTYTMPAYRTKDEWLAHAKVLREQILVSAGLWPMPPRTPLKARILERFDRGDYTVERVHMQTLPGFYLCGNLYRPKGRKGPFPGILNPHGHWAIGRLAETDRGSVPGRGIGLARLGCVAFLYDMVGYNDTDQVSHAYGGEREALWGISLCGLQLWNSIRALDFLLTLPDVDPTRIGCTGASGGGTQTFLLTAVDERVNVPVPAVMISAHMQGGCLCENAPLLRLDANNMEIGALAAPRPMLMIAATGDWTRNTATVEYPAIRAIYSLFGAEDRLAYRIFDAPHNYNKDSREAMYAWYGRWFLGLEDAEKCRERPFAPEQPRDLLVFYGRTPPRDRLDAEGLTRSLIARARKQLDAFKPRHRRGLERFQETYGVALQRALAAEYPDALEVTAVEGPSFTAAGFVAQPLTLGRRERGDTVPALLLLPSTPPTQATVLVHPEGKDALVPRGADRLAPLAAALLRAGHAVLAVDCFAAGESPAPERDPTLRYFETYNRTDTANRVQDILTALAWLGGRFDGVSLDLVGMKEAGLWALLAAALAPGLRNVAADAARFDPEDDAAYLARIPTPGLRRAGGFEAACVLALPARLLVHNAGRRFQLKWAAGVFRALKLGALLTVRERRATDAQVARWLADGRAQQRDV